MRLLNRNEFISVILVMAVFCYSIMVIPATGLCQEKRILKHAWGGMWEPFWLKDDNGKLSGFDIEILEAVVTGAGFSIIHTEYAVPWARHWKYIEHGDMDLCTSASRTAEREKFAYFTAPYRHEYLGLFFRKGEADNYDIKEIEDLLKYKDMQI